MNDISLKPYNTFGFDVKCRYFEEVKTIEELKAVLCNPKYNHVKKLLLGGGSNILLLEYFDGLVIKNNLKGIKIIEETPEFAIVSAGAGEVWHEFVLFAISKNLGGIENLSLIPGTVGAAPMQNIGAYGAEIKDTFYSLEALNIKTLEVETFNNEQCKFGYRDSYFKQEGKDKYIILNVSFKLSKNTLLNVSYGAIQQTLQALNVTMPTIKDVSNAVIKIRQSKLPDPAQIGNAGSFFKNPIISKEDYLDLKENYPDLPGYVVDDTQMKIAAGWLIEQAGWKGQKIGNVGVHANQALVLVHFGGGKGTEIASLAASIQKSVYNKFNIEISPEVNFIN